MHKFSLTGHFPVEALAFAQAAERDGRLIQTARRGLAAGHGFTVPAWRALYVAANFQGPLTIAQLARQLRVTRQSAQQTVATLRRQALVNLTTALKDRRSQRVLLTPQGAAVLGELASAMRLLLLEVTNDLTVEELVVATVSLNGLARRIRDCETLLARRRPVART